MGQTCRRQGDGTADVQEITKMGRLSIRTFANIILGWASRVEGNAINLKSQRILCSPRYFAVRKF